MLHGRAILQGHAVRLRRPEVQRNLREHAEADERLLQYCCAAEGAAAGAVF